MSSLPDRQADFAAALLEPRAAIPTGLVVPPDVATMRRFSVYRNNVTAGLIEVLRESHPAVVRLVGREFFDALALEFVRSEPPRSALMYAYGDGFGDFIKQHRACEDLPYLADVARIERAWLDAYHAAEADPLEAASLLGLDAKALSALHVGLHPTLRIVASIWPALSIWHANVTEAEVDPIALDRGGEIALLVRPHADVTVRSISPGAYELIKAIKAGSDLLAAAQTCAEIDADLDLGRTLEMLIAAGVFTINTLPTAGEPKGVRK